LTNYSLIAFSRAYFPYCARLDCLFLLVTLFVYALALFLFTFPAYLFVFSLPYAVAKEHRPVDLAKLRANSWWR